MKLIKAILLSLLTVTVITAGLFVLTIIPAWLSTMVSIIALVTIFTGFWYKGSYGESAITPQILEKNGFVKIEENEYLRSYHLVVPTISKENSSVIQMTFYKDPIAGVNTLFKCWSPTPPPDYEAINEIHLCNLKSVHELQQALNLCGIKKEIKLC